MEAVEQELTTEPERDLRLDPIINRDDPENISANNGAVIVAALNGARVFKRNAIKAIGTPNATRVCWVVVELNGVRVYINGDQIVVSTDDLNP